MSPKISARFLLSIFSAFFVVSASLVSTGAKSGTDVDAANYLSTGEKELIREINLLRSDPAKYASYLEQMKKYYKGKNYQPPTASIALATNEGVSAVDEAIVFLRAQKPVPAYLLSQGLSLAARDHVKDLGKTGNVGHRGSDGSTTESRSSRYGRFSNGIGENIVYQTDTAREVVLGWLVDDGVATRGHRRNLLSPTYRFIGVALGERSNFGTMTVLTFAGAYVEGGPTAKPAKAVATGKTPKKM